MHGGGSPVDLDGQVALVTGATGGLGGRVCRTLSLAGARVALVSRRKTRLEALAADIRRQGGICEPFVVDISNCSSLQTVVTRVEEKLGLVTILVNNAGTVGVQHATKMPLELIDNLINVNLRAPFVLSCQVAQRLIAERHAGRVINISSMSASHYQGDVAAALYSTTKAGVNRMTETLAVEWARFEINVNAIAPGAFDTEMMEGAGDHLDVLKSAFPRRRLGIPEQLDSTILYLVDPASEFVTGAIIKVDDGQCAR